MQRSVLACATAVMTACVGFTLAAQTPSTQTPTTQKPMTGQQTPMTQGKGAGKTTQVHPGKAGSPHVRSEYTVKDANISVEYGRPSLKGRTPGKDIDPYDGREWRLGADEATTLTTDKALKFGNVAVPAGTYTLYAMPSGGTWELIISKKTGQWGVPYPKGEDLGRVPMMVSKTAAPVEQLTISVEPNTASGHGGGMLKIEWGNTSASAPFTVG